MVNRSTWQMQRSDLNHGWLKNRFLAHLQSALEMDESETVNCGYFMEEILPGWNRNAPILHDLISSYEKSESPERILETFPLCRMDKSDRDWLGTVIHQCWLNRTGAKAMMGTALNCFEKTQASVTRLDEEWALCRHVHAVPVNHPLADALRNLLDASCQLRDAISAFPHTIELCRNKR